MTHLRVRRSCVIISYFFRTPHSKRSKMSARHPPLLTFISWRTASRSARVTTIALHWPYTMPRTQNAWIASMAHGLPLRCGPQHDLATAISRSPRSSPWRAAMPPTSAPWPAPGSSIAHALPEAGMIAMVVAGQFPLSFEGSIRLVEVLYEGLLWGTDPRRLIFDVRRRLYSQFPARHDWASLTTYLSLPRDFENQLSAVKIKQAMESINAAMSHADEALRRTSPQRGPNLVPAAAGQRHSVAGGSAAAHARRQEATERPGYRYPGAESEILPDRWPARRSGRLRFCTK